MFCFSCKYIPESPIKECVDSILKFYPNEKILIADSKSEDKTYFDLFLDYENVEIFEENEDRQVGSLWESYRRYPDEKYYILIQDTFILRKSIDEYINSQNLFISFTYFSEKYKTSYHVPQNEWNDLTNFIEKVLSETKYKVPSDDQRIYGCFGPIFIVKNKLMKKFESKGLIKSFKTRNHLEQQAAERIFGICAEQEGYSPLNCNIEGNWSESKWKSADSTFKKHFLMTSGLRLD